MIAGPPFFRYVATLVYDVFIMFSIWMLVIAFCVWGHIPAWLHGPCLLLSTYILYLFCWTHGGQTLGALAWHIRVVSIDGQGLTWQHASIRFIVGFLSLLFLGLWQAWALFDPHQQTLVDYLARTRLAHTHQQ